MTWSRDIGQTNPDHNITPGPSEWDVLYFKDTICPGIARVTPRLSADIDKRKPKGVKKSQAKDRGMKPSKVKVEITLLPGDLEEFRREIVPLIAPKGKNDAQDPIELNHPALEMWGLHLFIVEDVQASPPNSGGTMEISIDFLEWIAQPEEVKPKTVVGEPKNAVDLIEAIAPAARNAIDRLFG